MTASYAGDVAYNSSTSATRNQNVRDYSVAISPPSQNVKAGASTTYTLTITPVNGFATIPYASGGPPRV